MPKRGPQSLTRHDVGRADANRRPLGIQSNFKRHCAATGEGTVGDAVESLCRGAKFVSVRTMKSRKLSSFRPVNDALLATGMAS